MKITHYHFMQIPALGKPQRVIHNVKSRVMEVCGSEIFPDARQASPSLAKSVFEEVKITGINNFVLARGIRRPGFSC